MTNPRIRIIVCDDHKLIREGLRKVFSQQEDIEVIAEASDSAELLNVVSSVNADLIITDINLPGRSGLDILADLRRRFPSVPIIVLSMYSEDRFALRALRSGAAGYLPKGSEPDEMVRAVRKVANGGRYLTERSAELLMDDLDRPATVLPHDRLSRREFEIFLLLVNGLNIRQIAERLHLSISTVNTYRARIFEKMQLGSDVELVRYAIENDLTS